MFINNYTHIGIYESVHYAIDYEIGKRSKYRTTERKRKYNRIVSMDLTTHCFERQFIRKQK